MNKSVYQAAYDNELQKLGFWGIGRAAKSAFGVLRKGVSEAAATATTAVKDSSAAFGKTRAQSQIADTEKKLVSLKQRAGVADAAAAPKPASTAAKAETVATPKSTPAADAVATPKKTLLPGGWKPWAIGAGGLGLGVGIAAMSSANKPAGPVYGQNS